MYQIGFGLSVRKGQKKLDRFIEINILLPILQGATKVTA